jgi:hypothetical protein
VAFRGTHGGEVSFEHLQYNIMEMSRTGR